MSAASTKVDLVERHHLGAPGLRQYLVDKGSRVIDELDAVAIEDDLILYFLGPWDCHTVKHVNFPYVRVKVAMDLARRPANGGGGWGPTAAGTSGSTAVQ